MLLLVLSVLVSNLITNALVNLNLVDAPQRVVSVSVMREIKNTTKGKWGVDVVLISILTLLKKDREWAREYRKTNQYRLWLRNYAHSERNKEKHREYNKNWIKKFYIKGFGYKFKSYIRTIADTNKT